MAFCYYHSYYYYHDYYCCVVRHTQQVVKVTRVVPLCCMAGFFNFRVEPLALPRCPCAPKWHQGGESNFTVVTFPFAAGFVSEMSLDRTPSSHDRQFQRLPRSSDCFRSLVASSGGKRDARQIASRRVASRRRGVTPMCYGCCQATVTFVTFWQVAIYNLETQRLFPITRIWLLNTS